MVKLSLRDKLKQVKPKLSMNPLKLIMFNDKE